MPGLTGAAVSRDADRDLFDTDTEGQAAQGVLREVPVLRVQGPCLLSRCRGPDRAPDVPGLAL